jgi:hypothetical protein
MAAKALSGDSGELRLARVHTLCKQLSATKGAARAH